MAEYDLPAMNNYVLDMSKRPTLIYVGHSAGMMQAFAGFSLNQEVAKRVSYFGALAPVAYTGGTTSPMFRGLAKIYFGKLSSLFGETEFLGSSLVVQGVVVKYSCAFADVACDSLINALMSPSVDLNHSRAHVYLSHMPTSTSVKNVGHSVQGIRGNAFRRFDYGCTCVKGTPVSLCPTALCKIKAVYDVLEPLAFDLSKMWYPCTALFTGRNDLLSTASDVAKLCKELPAGTVLSETSLPYNHVDFTWASNAGELLDKDLVAQIQQYEGQGY